MKPFKLLGLFLLCGLFSPGLALGSVFLELQHPGAVIVGGQFDVTVKIIGSDHGLIAGFQTLICFDDSVLALTGYRDDKFFAISDLGGATIYTPIGPQISAPGQFGALDISLTTPVSCPYDRAIATFTFSALQAGATQFSLCGINVVTSESLVEYDITEPIINDEVIINSPVGSLTAVLSPQGAIDGGARWLVDGGSWQESGATVTGLSVGEHALSFKDVTGWNTPSDQSVSIVADQTTQAAGTYTPITYPIMATAGPNGSISPEGTVDVGYGEDQIFNITPDGGYGIADLLVDGSSVEPLGTYTFTNVTSAHSIAAGFEAETPVAAFSGSPVSGDSPVTVTFTDASAGIITAWSWVFGDTGTSTDQNPTHLYTGPGTYTVSLTVTGPGGSDTETKTDYITVTTPVGSLTAVLSPQGAIDGGARWRVDGGSWQESGATVTGLSVGEHALGFKDVTGWNTPSDQSVSIVADQTTQAAGTYTLQPADMVYVDAGGLCGGHSPCYRSIAEGISEAADDATIKISQGVYEEDIILDEPKALIILGGWDAAFTIQSAYTTVNSLQIRDGKIISFNLILQPLSPYKQGMNHR